MVKYHILKEKMRDNLAQPKYADFVRWYRKHFKNNFEYFKKEYYMHLKEIEKHKPFPE